VTKLIFIIKIFSQKDIFFLVVIQIIFSYSRWVEIKGSLKEMGAGRKSIWNV